jgi:hypothetical protein
MLLAVIQFRRPKPLPTLVSLLRCSGGDEGARTPDLCLAKAALSRLSYIPIPTNRVTQWAFQDSNLRPFPYQRNALTN